MSSGSDLAAMDGAIDKIPSLCPKLKAEAAARRAAIAKAKVSSSFVARDKIEIKDLQALSVALGEANAIRTLCNGDEDSLWRSYMLNLLSYFAGKGDVRALMTDAFNIGYRSENRKFSTCPASAVTNEADIAKRIINGVMVLKPSEHGADVQKFLSILMVTARSISARS